MFKINRNLKKPVHVTKTFRIPTELSERLDVLVRKEKISLNRLIIQCCEYALDNLDTTETDK